ncbi:MAG TPA: hypothetical protein VJN01_08175, partial [Xanthomonadales bacterium]|nr:hypothetical protein [Xanthomonadales bacterium]
MAEQPASQDLKPKAKRGWKFWLKLISFALLILYPVNMFVGCVTESVKWSRPTRTAVCCNTPADAEIDYEDVSFKNADGQTLRGWFMPGDNGATVILVHGVGGMRVSVIRHSLILAGGGFSVLSFDLRA